MGGGDGRLYVLGQDRNEQQAVSHLYRGRYSEVGDPMCARGWNRSDGQGYSIFRNCAGAAICQVCLRRALQKRDPVKPVKRKTKWL